jgi:hypothetical protein
MLDKPPRRTVVKETGEAVLVWIKVFGYSGLALTGIVQGTAIVDVLQRLVG